MTAWAALVISVVAAVASAGGNQLAGATISGVIVSADTPSQPVRRAIITLTGGSIPNNLSAVADDEGRFAFLDLSPGRYTMTATKAAYLLSAYGATRPGRPGTSIVLTAGQKVDVRIALPRGAVITGTVRDQFGQPAAGIQVTVSRAETVGGSGGFTSSADSLTTDDRGVYRAFGLMPDEYVVSAVPRISGNAEIERLTRAALDAKMRALEQRFGGVPSASGSVPAAAGAVDPASRTPETAEQLGYAPTFYPGTTVAANASRVRVAAGEERGAVDIPLVPVRVARVSGVLQSGDIPVQRIRPMLTTTGPPQPVILTPQLTGPSADGAFSFSNVTPGRYTLLAQTGQGAMMATPDGRGGTSVNPGTASMFATTDVTVDGVDITGLTLTLRPTLSLSGRVVFDGTTMKPPEKLSAIRVALTRAGPASMPTVMNGVGLGPGPPPSASVREDGTFQLIGVIPGTYGVSAASTGWWLRSVMLNGRDLLDDPLEVDGSSGDFTGAIITFLDRRSELQGTLTAASGQPASEFTVLVFPAAREQWRAGSRRIRTARPASDGAFTVMDLPAGEYLVAALTDVDPADLRQAAFLEQIVAAAVKITIADGQKVRQDLRIAR